jgi:hypothetical protein
MALKDLQLGKCGTVSEEQKLFYHMMKLGSVILKMSNQFILHAPMFEPRIGARLKV